MYRCLRYVAIYPLGEPSLTGSRMIPLATSCPGCFRPTRLFGSVIACLGDSLTCHLCAWKKQNFALIRLQCYRLWHPSIDDQVKSVITQFLCHEGMDVTSGWGAYHVEFSTPEIGSTFSLAFDKAWHSILLTGARLAHPTQEPLALPTATQGSAWISHRRLVARWIRMSHLSRNPFWSLILSCPTQFDLRNSPIDDSPFFRITSFLGSPTKSCENRCFIVCF